MQIKNLQDYKQSLKNTGIKIFAQGEQINDVTTYPLFIPHINCAGQTYELANNEEYKLLLTTNSHLNGEVISRFTNITQSKDDLLIKTKMMRLLGQKTASCFQRCVGYDGLNAVFVITHKIDRENKTNYHQKFLNYLKKIQKENFFICGAMTDAKGNRALRPSEQFDKDSFVHVVEKKSDGVIVSGAKMHITGAVNSHEVLVMPTLSLKEDEKDFAIAFALPLNTKGITLIFGRQANDTRRLEGGTIDTGNYNYGVVGGEALIIFDNVFVPDERIFLNGETNYTGELVELFANCHRQNYGGCKVGLGDVLIGALTYLCEIQGTAKASHIRDKIVEMVHLSETMYSSSLACGVESKTDISGAFLPNPLYANVTKLNTTRFTYELARLSHDIAGGFIATLPSEKDLKNDEIGHYIKKYYKTHQDIPSETRIKIARLIENMTQGTTLTECMQGAGSPQAQRIMILRQANLLQKQELAKKIAGIE